MCWTTSRRSFHAPGACSPGVRSIEGGASVRPGSGVQIQVGCEHAAHVVRRPEDRGFGAGTDAQDLGLGVDCAEIRQCSGRLRILPVLAMLAPEREVWESVGVARRDLTHPSAQRLVAEVLELAQLVMTERRALHRRGQDPNSRPATFEFSALERCLAVHVDGQLGDPAATSTLRVSAQMTCGAVVTSVETWVRGPRAGKIVLHGRAGRQSPAESGGVVLGSAARAAWYSGSRNSDSPPRRYPQERSAGFCACAAFERRFAVGILRRLRSARPGAAPARPTAASVRLIALGSGMPLLSCAR